MFVCTNFHSPDEGKRPIFEKDLNKSKAPVEGSSSNDNNRLGNLLLSFLSFHFSCRPHIDNELCGVFIYR